MDEPLPASAGCADLLPPGLEARPYQQRIILRAIDLFRGAACDRHGRAESEAGSVLIESPTGSGKTVMGLAIARWMQNHLGLTVGWAAMRRNLLSQAAAENARGFGVDLRPISMFDKRPPRVDLLVIDEAQHDGALSMANLHGYIKPRKILGLSATPFRGDRFKLCFEKSIRDAGIHNLIQEGYLSPYHHYTIPSYTPDGVARAYAREPGRWGKSLIFFHTLDECRRCAARLAGLGIPAELVTAKTDRDRQIADFNAGRVDVMINMLILSEGFDCPSLRTVFCRPSGRLCTVQMCGRVLRRHGGTAFKQIVQCEQTCHPFPRTATPAEQYLSADRSPDRDRGESVSAGSAAPAWRSLRANGQIEAICHRMQALIAASPASLPKMLTQPALVTPDGQPRRGRSGSWRRFRSESDVDFVF